MKVIITAILVACCAFSFGQRYQAIYSGVPWFDDRGQVVSAHGACIVKDKSRYYLFGERHTDTSNAFAGFNCYSSTDLYNWKFESIALPVQDSGRLGPDRVGERVKVMKCPATGEYVMYMHTDDMGYRDQCVGYATAKKITGPYTFHGPLLFNGKPIKKWDMGAFQDKDGSGYVLIHSGELYKLSDDYKSVVEFTKLDMPSQFESPAVFRKDSIYYWLGSHLTSWERNDNYYYTATSLKGPWTHRGTFAPEGTLTWNSQTTFVLPVGDGFMYMGDRWSFPKQASAATYVWLPLKVEGTAISLPEYNEVLSSWREVKNPEFTGTQVAVYGSARPDGGYARITLTNSKGKTLFSAIVDMYCKYPVSTLKFVSPLLPKGRYKLIIKAMDEHSSWSDKRKSNYGSTGNIVSIDKIVVQ